MGSILHFGDLYGSPITSLLILYSRLKIFALLFLIYNRIEFYFDTHTTFINSFQNAKVIVLHIKSN